MNDLELQREAIIEIVGTQYDGRIPNHVGLCAGMRLKLKHQLNNPHDENAVSVLTEDGKELGFIPKGQASVYAPAIDSQKYQFTVTVIKAVPDSSRPILIVKITAEFEDLTEETAEQRLVAFVQMTINEFAAARKHYLHFIKAETVDVQALAASLNEARMLRSLYALMSPLVEKYELKPVAAESPLPDKETLEERIRELRMVMQELIRTLQKRSSDAFNIDDEELFQQIQNKVREKRKTFRGYDQLCEQFQTALLHFTPVTLTPSATEQPAAEGAAPVTPEPAPDLQESALSERRFSLWLVQKEHLSEDDARQYCANIRSIEKLYQTALKEKKPFFDAPSLTELRTQIETIRKYKDFIDANRRRNNSFADALEKFALFAGIYVPPQLRPIRAGRPGCGRNPEPGLHLVNFESPAGYSWYKPAVFWLYEKRHSVGKWIEVYQILLRLLYEEHEDIMRRMIGTPLVGRTIDFADEALKSQLRRPVRLTHDMYYESNLSSEQILRAIIELRNRFDIDPSQIEIWVSAERTGAEASAPAAERSPAPPKAEPPVPAPEPPAPPPEPPAPPKAEPPREKQEDFAPDLSQPFDLKTALVALLSTEDRHIAACRGHKGGMMPSVLQNLIKQYYHKTVVLYEISMLLMRDGDFRSVARQFYALNPERKKAAEKPAAPEPEPVQTHPEEALQAAPEGAKPPEAPPPQETTSQADEETILYLIHKHKDSVYNRNGFDAYTVRSLLRNEGITDVSEAEIEQVLSASAQLEADEYGFYHYKETASPKAVPPLEDPVPFAQPAPSAPPVPVIPEQEAERHITLRIGGEVCRALNCTDAFKKICEAAINCKAFPMARITGQKITINGRQAFFRSVVPVAGYHPLSNGLQMTSVSSLQELRTLTAQLISCCGLDQQYFVILSQ